MCGQLGMGELVIILVIVVFIFGGAKLPQLAESLGKSIKVFKKSVSSQDEIDVTPKQQQIPAPQTQAAPVAEAAPESVPAQSKSSS